jgi:hypothetical protein
MCRTKRLEPENGGDALDLCQSQSKKSSVLFGKSREPKKRIKGGFEDMAVKEIVT